MSRGLGRRERAVLAVFEAEPDKLENSIAVVIRLHGVKATESEYSATRRALNSLQKKKLLTRLEGNGWRFGRSVYALPAAAEAYQARYELDKATLGRSSRDNL